MSSEIEASQVEQDLKTLEAFLVGNEDLDRLETLLDRFNIFEAIGMVRRELNHSQFLAYLLDPRNNHGLGDLFVKRLLQNVLSIADEGEKRVFMPISAIELELWDLERMTVQREWHHVDILLRDVEHRLVVVIENKIKSGEHSDQLQRYLDIVEGHHAGWRVIPLFLTPDGRVPSHESYLAVDYSLVSEVIDAAAESRAAVVNPDVKTLMTHYTDMLRRNIVGDSDVARLCRQIYQKHKKALDLIYEHRPDLKAETRDFLKGLVGRTEGLAYKGRHRNSYLFFRPQEWEEVPAFNAGDATSGFLRFVFHNFPGRLDLYLETSPGEEETRHRLYEMGQKDELLFNELDDPGADNHPKLYRRVFLTPRFSEDATDTEREEEIRRHWAEFLEDDLPRIEEALRKETWIWEPVG